MIGIMHLTALFPTLSTLRGYGLAAFQRVRVPRLSLAVTKLPLLSSDQKRLQIFWDFALKVEII